MAANRVTCTVGNDEVSFYMVTKDINGMQDIRVTREKDGTFHGIMCTLIGSETCHFAGLDLSTDSARVEWFRLCMIYTKTSGDSLKSLLGL